MDILFHPIGVIHTPYKDHAPFQPVETDRGSFKIIIDKAYTEALHRLSDFHYIYVVYYLDRTGKKPEMTVRPPWAEGLEVGLFASRSPNRPNPVGISVVRLLKVEENTLVTSGLDVLDQTPLIDIKPYINELDAKPDANYGWMNDMNDREHQLIHIKGIPHNDENPVE
jgi:tRNA (adenine37-N6)-methyltransferase